MSFPFHDVSAMHPNDTTCFFVCSCLCVQYCGGKLGEGERHRGKPPTAGTQLFQHWGLERYNSIGLLAPLEVSWGMRLEAGNPSEGVGRRCRC